MTRLPQGADDLRTNRCRDQGFPPASARARFVGHRASLAALSWGHRSRFGDIGTSPLYTLKECLLAFDSPAAQAEGLFGVLSLMFWALIMVVTVKYVWFIMRADNHGEGGIFALLALVPERFRKSDRPSGRSTAMGLLAVIGAALLYGDGVITPAISVLAVED
jgi:KUP system potassium uptake protein